MNTFKKLISWYFSKNSLPYWAVLLLDSAIIVFSNLVSLYMWRGGLFFAQNFWHFIGLVAIIMPLMWIFMKVFHTYSGILRYSSFVDLVKVACALICGYATAFACLQLLICFHLVKDGISKEALLVSMMLSIALMWSLRIVAKYLFGIVTIKSKTHRAFIFGVREGGVSIAQSIRNEHPVKFSIKGFLTPEKKMVGRSLYGARVYSADENLEEVIRRLSIEYIFVSPLYADEFRGNNALIDRLTKFGVRIMMMPAAEKWDGKSDLSHQQLHEVDIEDLLPRDKIQVDMDAIGSMLKGKRILITGAAGSIGSEMVRQIARFSPAELVLVDQAETPMHDVRLFMARHYPYLTAPTIVGSISNSTQMEMIFREHRPEYVFHAAAYKHVPMMEDNPAMAVQNNIYGTRIIADLAVKYGTKKFVMISTDKAVNPTNVMGCSKRICEIYCQSLNQKIEEVKKVQNVENVKESDPLYHSLHSLLQADGSLPCTQFITTRFGNVLGSNGSVIPIFRDQIKKGGPVTVTHPDIIRFFMLIPEACQLVLEAGTMGKGGEIFVFDMGKPVRIVDLAKRMIALSGAKDIEIKFTGLRDGEKLYEEVLNDAEQTMATPNPKIKVARVREYPYEDALRNEQELYDLSFSYDDMAIVKKMKEIVPEFKSQISKYEVLDK